jgi:hypothetical protein
VYAYSLNEEDYHGPYSTVARALAEAEGDLVCDHEPGDEVVVWVGRVEEAGGYVEKMKLAEHLVEYIEECLGDDIPYHDSIVAIESKDMPAFDKELKELIARHLHYRAFGIKDAVEHTITLGES